MFTAFVSDLHLTPDRPEIAQRFLRFLEGDATHADAVYILGDLFEHWVGDDVGSDRFSQSIIAAMRALTAGGVRLRIMHGNRDFLLRAGFEKATGAQLIDDPTVVDLYGRKTLLMHGDTLCTDDVRYQSYRSRVRAPMTQRLFFLLPRFVRASIADMLRRESARSKRGKSNEILDVTPSAVEAAFRAHECAYLIHGHTHRPARHEYEVDGTRRERWVLAEWLDRGEYLRCDASAWKTVLV